MTGSVTGAPGLARELAGVARAASDLLVGSDVMAVVVLAASAGAWLLAGWVQMRAAAPEVSHGRCLLARADLLVAPSLTDRARASSGAALSWPRQPPASLSPSSCLRPSSRRCISFSQATRRPAPPEGSWR